MRIPRPNDVVILHIPAYGEVEKDNGDMVHVTVPKGDEWAVHKVSVHRPPQGLAFTLIHWSGVVAVIDETDLVDGEYPFTLLARPTN